MSYANLNYSLEILCGEGEAPYRVGVMAESPDAALTKALHTIQRDDYILAEIHEHRSDGTTAAYSRVRRIVLASSVQVPNYKTFNVKMRRAAA